MLSLDDLKALIPNSDITFIHNPNTDGIELAVDNLEFAYDVAMWFINNDDTVDAVQAVYFDPDNYLTSVSVERPELDDDEEEL